MSPALLAAFIAIAVSIFSCGIAIYAAQQAKAKKRSEP